MRNEKKPVSTKEGVTYSKLSKKFVARGRNEKNVLISLGQFKEKELAEQLYTEHLKKFTPKQEESDATTQFIKKLQEGDATNIITAIKKSQDQSK